LIDTNNLVTGNPYYMKQLNRSTILSMIRNLGPIPRAQIAKLTNLTPTTVTNIVSELLEEGLVLEMERGTSKAGRKPILLELNQHAGFVLGIDIGSKKVTAIGFDLLQQQLAHIDRDLPVPLTRETFLQFIQDTVEIAIQAIVAGTDFTRDKLKGIGVGMHGIVDSITGRAIYAPHLKLDHIPIGETLSQHFEVDVKVDNDVRVMAVGEGWVGNARDINDFLSINVGYGIGSAIVIGKNLYQGHTFSAGEIAHTTVDSDGLLCTCGRYGCLQAMASGFAIMNRTVKAIKKGEKSIIPEMVEHDLDKVSGKIVHEAAIQGDPLAIRILEETGHYLGVSISELVKIFNPQMVIVGGGVANADEFIFAPLKAAIEERSKQFPYTKTEVQKCAFGQDATAIGAASMILKTLFAATGNM
jgi:predicted NBD/HSP70 family sugar kinase